MKQTITLLFFSFILIPNSVIAADSIFVAGTYISIGMPKSIVLDHIPQRYTISKVNEDGSSWAITENSDGNTRLIAVIEFQQDKVSWVAKMWGSFENKSSVEFARELASLFSSLAEAGFSNASVSVGQLREPREKGETITFSFGKRSVILNITYESRFGGPSVSIQENLTK